ncbi:MAG: hypothetical protein PHV74_13810 [Dehalococcoidia bacterium]|nr:hypothetical protein [Dehalococcoidia bacterium]
MRVQVRKLREVMGLLQPVISKKPTIKVIGNILLKDGKAIASDLENTLILDFPEATEELLIHKDALDFLRFIPGDTMAEISGQAGENRTLLISCGGSKRTCPWADVEEYPPLPLIPHLTWHLDGDRLLDALGMAVPYVCNDASRPLLTGVTVELGEQLSFVAAGDGHRMFYQEIKASASDPATMVIPLTTVALLNNLWRKASKPADPAVDALLFQVALAKRLISLGIRIEQKEDQAEGLMAAQFGDVTLLSKLITGTPPRWTEVIPQDPPQKLKVFAQDLYRSLLQVKDVAQEANNIVRLSWTDNTLKVVARGIQTAEAECFATIIGGEGHIAFNLSYLLEYLKGRQGLVEIGVISPQQAARFLNGQCTVVIMPVSVKEDGPEETSNQAGEGSEARKEGEGSEQGEAIQESDQGKPEEAQSPQPSGEEKEPVTAASTPAKPKKPRRPSKAKK